LGCRAAAFLQKLPLRRGAKSTERLGLLSWFGLVSSTFEILQEDQKDRRSEGGKNAFFNSEDRIEKYSSRAEDEFANRGRQRGPKISRLLPFCPSCENLDRAKWPGFATEASAIRAAAWQQKM
jgi:hypothetical protein